MHLPPERLRLQLGADPDATVRLGEAIGQHLEAGDVLALCGDLGAGKTTLARGVARGLAIDDPDSVASPTYLLVIEHAGPVRLLHADAYLPDKLAAFLADGGLEYLFARDAVTVLEWADRVATSVPAGALWLELQPNQAGGRVAILRQEVPRPWLAGLGA